MDASQLANAPTHIMAISEVIRLAVAPVFLLTAIATIGLFLREFYLGVSFGMSTKLRSPVKAAASDGSAS